MDFNKGKELIGLIVRNKRDKLKLTQEELSARISLDQSNLSNIENGKNFPAFTTFCALVEVLIMNNKFNKVQFGRRLKEIRKAKGFTQENVCEKANLDVSNYSKMETGRVTPSLSSLYKIIKCAGFVPNEIFECEHLLEEKELDTVVINEYTSLSLKKKQTLYRIMQILKEFE